MITRILDSPHLATVVPQLAPDVLQRLVRICGLEDCGQIVALATPAQLDRVFDLDLWRPLRPGSDDELDPERFSTWLEVFVEAGPEIAAQKLAGMDVEIIVAALAQHIRVFDHSAIAGSAIDDEMQEPRRTKSAMWCEIGSFVIEAKRPDAWDAVVSVLATLATEHPASFHQVMSGCRHLSNAGWELDGLDDLLSDNEQDMFDLSVARERRREEQGYVSPPQARAFLQSARQLRLTDDAPPPSSVVARAYFRGLDRTSSADRNASGTSQSAAGESDRDPASPASSDTFNAIVELLGAETQVARQPRALLGDGGNAVTATARFEAHMQIASERDPVAYATRSEELAYLANVILAGCSTQGRSFTPREASDAAVAVCNLGLENFPARWLPDAHDRAAGTRLPEAFLITHGLIAVFQVGWTVLYVEVVLRAAERLIRVLDAVRSADYETQAGFDDLCVELTRQWRAGTPWCAREALDVLLIVDQPAWATLVALISEYPVIHAGLAAARDGTTVNASAFDFISENRQIKSIDEFLELLPEIFAG